MYYYQHYKIHEAEYLVAARGAAVEDPPVRGVPAERSKYSVPDILHDREIDVECIGDGPSEAPTIRDLGADEIGKEACRIITYAVLVTNEFGERFHAERGLNKTHGPVYFKSIQSNSNGRFVGGSAKIAVKEKRVNRRKPTPRHKFSRGSRVKIEDINLEVIF